MEEEEEEEEEEGELRGRLETMILVSRGMLFVDVALPLPLPGKTTAGLEEPIDPACLPDVGRVSPL